MKNPLDYLRRPIYDLKGHLAHVRKLHQSYPLRTYEQQVRFTQQTMAVIEDRQKDLGLLKPNIRTFVEDMYAGSIFRPSPPEAESREFLQQYQAQITDPSYIENVQLNVITAAFRILDAIPPFERISNLTVPLSTLTKQLPALIARLMLDTTEELFFYYNYVLQKNVYDIAGIDRDGPAHKLISPKDYDGDPVDYVRGTPFYDLLNAQVPFALPRKALSEHTFIIAKPGHGKTQLLGSGFVAQFLRDPEQPGLFILDPAGDFFEVVRDRVPPERLVVLDPETDPPPLNFFDFQNATEAESLQSFYYLMSTLSGGLSEKQGAIVPYLLKLLRAIAQSEGYASLDTLREIVEEKSPAKYAAAIATLDPIDQGFFANQWHHGDMSNTRQAIGWKIYGAMGSAAFRKMFVSSTNSFNARDAMRDRKVVIVRGSELTLGEHGLPVFMQYVVSQVFLAALTRFRLQPNERHQCYLICDEASHIFNHQTTRILTECRKLGLGFIAATQLIEQIPTEVKAAIYGATAIKFAGDVSHTDANTMANEMRTKGHFIQGMKSRPPKEVDWAVYVSNLTDRAIKVTVPMMVLEGMPMQKAAPVPVTAAEPPSSPVIDKKPTPAPEHVARGDTPDILPPPDDDPSKPQRGKWIEK